MAAFDYIVIGAGSAGAALAVRLSEDAACRVLVVEAGPDYRSADAPEAMRSPNFWEIIEHGGYHWPELEARMTETQAPRPYLQGRGLGGSSAINAQGAVRGMLDDFDLWAQQGCVGWSGTDVLLSFIRLEDDLDFGARPYHGRGGPLPIWRNPADRWSPLSRAFREAALDLGYPRHNDVNAPDSTGLSPGAWNRRADARVSTNDAYLEPARGRSNLKVMGNVLVERVQVEGSRAVGVHMTTGNGATLAEAGEVILCASAVHSPAILMRSGIGPAAQLHALGIAVHADLPGVGQNLCDHPVVLLTLPVRPEARALTPRVLIADCTLRYSSGVAGTGGNDVSVVPLNVGAMGPAEGTLMIAVLQPFSRGRLTIRSPHSDTEPEVEFRMLSDPRDLVRLRDGVRRAARIAQHPAVRSVADEALAGTAGRPANNFTEEGLDTWLLAACEDYTHAVGTCRMGDPADPYSVVDPDCRVIGIAGLRVADASIMPNPPRAPTHLSTVMVAEHLCARMRGRR